MKAKLFLAAVIFLVSAQALRPRVVIHAPDGYTVQCIYNYGIWSEFYDDGLGVPANDDWYADSDRIRYVAPGKTVRLLRPLRLKENHGLLMTFYLYRGTYVETRIFGVPWSSNKEDLQAVVDMYPLTHEKMASTVRLFLWNKRGDFDFFRLHVFIGDDGKIREVVKRGYFTAPTVVRGGGT